MAYKIEIPAKDIAAIDALPDHPLILRGFRPRVACAGLGDLLSAAGCSTLSGYRADSPSQWVELSATAAIAAFERGVLDINVVDCPVCQDFDPTDRLSVPDPMERGNLYLTHPEWRNFRKSLVITQRGTFTPMHVDAFGMAGWMYLFAGRKQWELWDASLAPMFYDPVEERFYDDENGPPHPNTLAGAALDSLPRWEGEIGPGDLMWFPEGWLHRVRTSEDSYGYGGATLHSARLGQAVYSWLRDRRNGHSQYTDLRDLLRAVPGNDPAVQSALEAIDRTFESWQRNRE